MRALKVAGATLLVVLLLMADAAWLVRRAGLRGTKLETRQAWRWPAAVRSAILGGLEPGAPRVLWLEGPAGLTAVGLDGQVRRQQAIPGIITAATGDTDGDHADELAVLRGGAPPQVALVTGALRTLWTARLPSLERPARALVADLDGDGRGEVLVGGSGGVEAFSANGRPLWSYRFKQPPAPGEAGELRGLARLRAGRETRVAAGRRDGPVVILGALGQAVWDGQVAGLRRLRAADVDGDGKDEVLLGTDSGEYRALDRDGRVRLTFGLGEAVTEIRAFELDGNPKTTEIALGGKRGRVVVMGGAAPWFSADLETKVATLGGVDVDGDGREELIAVGEGRPPRIFNGTGTELGALEPMGAPERVLGAKGPKGERLAIVAGPAGVLAYRLERVRAPLWYSPLSAAAAGLAGVLIVALLLWRLPPREYAAPAEPETVFALGHDAARARIEALVAAGHVPRAQAAARLEQLARRGASPRATAPPPAPAPAPRARG